MCREAIISIAVLLYVLSGASNAACARAGGRDKAPAREEVTIQEQIRGLPPEAKTAYLRYLLGTGDEELAEIYFLLGVVFYEISEPDSALFYFSRAIEVDPEMSKAYVDMGVVLDEQGERGRALSMFELAARIDPGDVLAHSHAAFMRFQLADYDSAWRYLSEALQLDPDHPQPHFYLAIFFWEARVYREAMREWEKVVELDPGSRLAALAREKIIMAQKSIENATAARSGNPIR